MPENIEPSNRRMHSRRPLKNKKFIKQTMHLFRNEPYDNERAFFFQNFGKHGPIEPIEVPLED